MLGFDLALVPLALLFTFAIQPGLGGMTDAAFEYAFVLPYLMVIAAGLSFWLGICSVQLNAYDGSAVGMTAIFACALSGFSFLLSSLASLTLDPSTHVIFGISFFVFSAVSRAVLLQVVLAIYRRSSPHCRVLIYGAGTTGTQLVSAFRAHETITPVAFVDDNSALQGLDVAGLPVYTPVRIAEIVKDKKIDRVLLAVPSLSHPKQAQIARRLQKMGLEVQTIPSFSQLIGEEALIDKLKPVPPQNFLTRPEVAATLGEGSECYLDKVVLISGAGGTIGSELSRQVLDCRPRKIVLYELSELALYTVDMELRQMAKGMDVEIVPVLGSVTDPRQVRQVFADHSIQVVLHAAAYKHVPLVESNPLAGLANNVFGTQTLAKEAADAGVERIILVSSDKAVRPTNVMGASKRLAELVIQDLATRVPKGEGPIYTIVRFGNVLGSSGSVVPLFQEQLRRGGPITVTHPDVTRYFMTVPEAVKLVLKAGAMAEGGEIFVLDMGKPVSIMQLARQVIESAGYSVRDTANPDGDIEITITGLRPGEKMSEELTYSGNLIGTRHSKVFAAQEGRLSEIEIASVLRALRHALAASDKKAAIDVVTRWVEGYHPQVPAGRKTS
ncbi:nucleoside-diphosphate sugar epimerase/dehydratase [Thalassococcus sp. S3]|uniref:polysaccharide biosynthesis protein n=1 Tax=Thalassococcus sp. S3 TaxID=2017482 RepID=UPI001024486E|nr:nucleoside-diphosphate sugar epimerase/dehydratase [Thalassococcus sp. S3]QBF34195.1 nucleotide sugar epimerase [Thalassococcus sp. S3]